MKNNMPDFFRPSSKEGQKMRLEARIAARLVKKYPELVFKANPNADASADAIAWQLSKGDEQLKVFAAGQIIKGIELYGGGGGDPNSGYYIPQIH